MHSETCPICDGPTIASAATIAPFLVEHCKLETAETLIRYCAACDFAFFDRRLTPEEVALLYCDYRGDDYNEQRLRLEPSYAPYIPMFNDPLSDHYRGRIGDLLGALAALPEVRPSTILDFGGDGSIAARLFPAAEISHLDASAGVALQRDRFDLILASQVFEHISDPREAMARVAAWLEEDGLLLLDLPRDYLGPLSEALLWQERHGGPLTVMHEHINHFSARAIRRLLEAVGLAPVFEVETPFLPSILTIAGRPGSELVRRLTEREPERRLQWTADRIRERQAVDKALLAEQLTAAQLEVRTLAEQLTAAQMECETLSMQLAAARVALDDSLAAFAALRASHSWRLTAPLRGVRRLIGGR